MVNEPPSRPTINAIMNKFEQTESVLDLDRSGRPVTVTDQSNLDEASEILTEQPQTSTRRMSLQLGISQTSVRRVHKSLGLKA
ncbi:unnamed protein product, partial [Didymodactylos carnosus]